LRAKLAQDLKRNGEKRGGLQWTQAGLQEGLTGDLREKLRGRSTHAKGCVSLLNDHHRAGDPHEKREENFQMSSMENLEEGEDQNTAQAFPFQGLWCHWGDRPWVE